MLLLRRRWLFELLEVSALSSLTTTMKVTMTAAAAAAALVQPSLCCDPLPPLLPHCVRLLP